MSTGDLFPPERLHPLKVALQPALDAYGAALAEHSHSHDEQTGEFCCRCGWRPARPGRTPRRAIGLHITAARKRADKVYDAAADAVIAERRIGR